MSKLTWPFVFNLLHCGTGDHVLLSQRGAGEMEALTVMVGARMFSDTDGAGQTVEEALWDKRTRSTFEESNNIHGNQRRQLPRLMASIYDSKSLCCHFYNQTQRFTIPLVTHAFILNLYKTFPHIISIK